MDQKCPCERDETLIFSCAGSSNVGQIANQSAVDLAQRGLGRYVCLAGIGGHVSGMIESTKAGKTLVAIDGCPVACARKTLEHAGFHAHEYLQVTDFGIEKNHDFDVNPSHVEKVTNHLVSQISRIRNV